MPITPDFAALVDRLNQELGLTEARAKSGLELARELLSRFPNNVILIQYSAYLNAALLFIETSKRQIQSTTEAVQPTDIPLEIVRERGETLSNLLGRVLETKVRIDRLVGRLER